MSPANRPDVRLKRDYKSFDFTLLAAMCALTLIGIVMINSATTHFAGNLAMRQALWFGLGFVVLLLAAFIDYRFICRFYILIYLFCLTLLVGVLVYGYYFPDLTQTSRWFTVGEIKIQPSEFAKIFLILFLAAFIDKRKEVLNHPLTVLFLAAVVVTPVALVMVQPSLTSSIVLAFLSLSVLYVSGIGMKYILPIVLVVTPLGILIYQDLAREVPLFLDRVLQPFQIARLQTFVSPNPESDAIFQTERSVRALASGQFSGQGFQQGAIVQRGGLPEAHTDFIFSVIGEEFGFVGSVTVLALMLFIIVKCLLMAHRSADFQGRLIAVGVAAMFAFQVFTNVGVATGTLPNTGVPFPFVSYGGSSLWLNMVAIGLVINIGMTKHICNKINILCFCIKLCAKRTA